MRDIKDLGIIEIHRYGKVIDIHFTTDEKRDVIKDRLNRIVKPHGLVDSMLIFPHQISIGLKDIAFANTLYKFYQVSL